VATVKVSEHTDRARRGLPPLQRTKVTYDDKGRLSGDKTVARQNSTEVHHANRRKSVVPHARNSPSGRTARANAGIRGFDTDGKSRGVSSRRANLGSFAFNPKNPTGYQHVLMGEMIVAFGIIGVRAIADYVPSDDYHSPGSETPTKGATPIVLITTTLVIYFVLSFLATRGGWAARVAAAFGLLMIAGLMINSESELSSVASWIENIGTNATNQEQPSVPAQPSGNGGNSGPPTVPSTGPGSVGEPLS
jgi:hypothetical protein